MSMPSVSSSYLSQALLPSINQAQTQLSKLTIESSSGQYADLGLQLAGQSGYELSLRSEDDLLQALTSANGVANTNLSTSQTALGSLVSTAGAAAQQVTELLNQSGSGAKLQSIGVANLKTLTTVANTDLSGTYVFGGINSATAPFDDYFASPSSTPKTALEASFQSTFGFPVTSWQTSTITIAQMQSFIDGPLAAQFTSPSWGNWSNASSTNVSSLISPGQTVDTSTNANTAGFQQLAQGYAMLAEFGDVGLGSGAEQALASSALGLINGGSSAIAATQAQLGDSQNRITQANSAMGSQMTILQNQVSSLDSVDAASVATQLSLLQTQLETAYQLTAQISKLNLAQYIPS